MPLSCTHTCDSDTSEPRTVMMLLLLWWWRQTQVQKAVVLPSRREGGVVIQVREVIAHGQAHPTVT